jgi:hypothetical protein
MMLMIGGIWSKIFYRNMYEGYLMSTKQTKLVIEGG